MELREMRSWRIYEVAGMWGWLPQIKLLPHRRDSHSRIDHERVVVHGQAVQIIVEVV